MFKWFDVVVVVVVRGIMSIESVECRVAMKSLQDL